MRTLILIVATALAASGCNQSRSGALEPVKVTAEQLETGLADLREEVFVSRAKGEAPADIATLASLAPASVSITHGPVVLDKASGATVVSDVRITPKDNPQIGLAIATVKLWQLDEEFAKARLSGQRLSEAKPLASRIDIAGLSAFGLDTVLAPAMDAYTDTVVGVIDGATDGALSADPSAVAAVSVTPTRYDIGVERIILNDVHLRPWELTPAKLAADSDWAEVMPMLQGLAAFYRTIGVDTVGAYGMSVGMSFDGPSPGSIDMAIETTGYRGLRGADADMAILRGMSFTIDAPMPAPDAAAPAGASAFSAMKMSASVAAVDHSGVRLDKLAGYLARGVMPPRTETDLLSGGVMTMRDMKIGLQDRPLYSIATMTSDLSGFHWLVPARVRLSAEDYVFDVGNLMAFVEQAMTTDLAIDPASAPAELDQFRTVMAKAMPILEKHQLSAPSFDYEIGWDWNARTGATTIDYMLGLDHYGRASISAAGTLPTYDGVSALIPDEPTAANEDALQKLFADVTALKSAELVLTDQGGLEKTFALTTEFAQAFKDDMPPEAASFASMTPANLRGIASSGAYLMADTAGQEFPPARDLLRPFAAWITSGGEVRWRAAPKQPVTAALLEAQPKAPEGGMVERTSPAPSAAMFELFGLTATHTPPPGSKPAAN